ncbi:MAG: hypothetical protein IPP33_08745 [Flavobacteriales bacterium]|nr:hypothetical protein [Flavobacteriales bacterium]
MIVAGLWLTWAIFLRPVYAIALPLIAAGLLLKNTGHVRRPIHHVLFLFLPFIVFDGAWTWRNWTVHQQLRPLANSLYYPEFKEAPTYAIFQYLQCYGGNQAWWDPRADIRWFNVREGVMGRHGRLADNNVEPPLWHSPQDARAIVCWRSPTTWLSGVTAPHQLLCGPRSMQER